MPYRAEFLKNVSPATGGFSFPVNIELIHNSEILTVEGFFFRKEKLGERQTSLKIQEEKSFAHQSLNYARVI